MLGRPFFFAEGCAHLLPEGVEARLTQDLVEAFVRVPGRTGQLGRRHPQVRLPLTSRLLIDMRLAPVAACY